MTAALTPEPQYATGPGAAAASAGEARRTERSALPGCGRRRGRAAPRRRASGRGCGRRGASACGSPRRERISSASTVSSSRGRARNVTGSGSTGVGRERADVGAHVERAGVVVADVAEQPPAARRPARAVVEREHERAAGRSPQRRRRAPAWRRPAADADRRQPHRGRSWRGRSRCRDERRRGGARRRTHRAGARRRGRRSQRPPRRHVEAEHGVVGEALGQLPGRALAGRHTRRSRSAPSRTASRPSSPPGRVPRMASSRLEGR